MSARQFIKAGVMALFCLIAAACSTTRPDISDEDTAGTPSAPRRLLLPDDRREFARALALYSEAMRLEMNGQHEAAISNYIAAAAADLSNEQLQFRVALALIQDKRTDEAVAIMERAASMGRINERALIWLALVYRTAGKEDKALETYNRAIDLSPTSSVAYIEAAGILMRQGRGNDAIRRLETALTAVATNDQPVVMRVLGEHSLREATTTAQAGRRWPRLTEMRRQMESAARRWPDDQVLLMQLGNLRALDGDINGAIVLYDKLESQNPDDLSIKERLALSLIAAGNATGAVLTLERIAEKQPANPRVHKLLGDLHEQLGRTNDAIRSYDRAARHAPDDPLPFLKSAMLSTASGDHIAAEEILRQGIQGAPTQLRLREMLGYVLLSAKKYKESIVAFEAAAKKLGTPDARALTQNFLINFAIALQLGGKTAVAAERLAEAQRTNAVAVDVYASYILQEGSTNEIAGAVDVFALTEKSLPAEARIPMYRGLLLNALERHTEAVISFARAEELAPNARDPSRILTASFYFWYASACERTTNIARAATLFLKSLDLNPDNDEARNYLAYMWAEHNQRLDDALAQIRRALEAEPDNPAYRDTLAWIHFKRGDTEKALVEIQKASAKQDDDPVINDHHGDILAKLGRQKDAVEFWKRAYICGNETPELAAKLRAHGLDPATLEKAAAEHRAARPAGKK